MRYRVADVGYVFSLLNRDTHAVYAAPTRSRGGDPDAVLRRGAVNAVLWRWIPRVETIAPAMDVMNDAPFARVFDDANDSPKQDASELLDRVEAALAEPLIQICEKPTIAPSGNPRDYISLSIYWWPNPLTRIPYLHHDGKRNPEADLYDAPRLRQMVERVHTLSDAYLATGDVRYRQRAKEQLTAWFIDPNSSMNPHLTFAQMMPGWSAGGRQGIIEGLPIVRRLLDALAEFDSAGALSVEERRSLRVWFRSYLAWLQHSRPGRAEAARLNNHGTWYDVQVAALARSLGLDDLASQVIVDSRVRLDPQFRSDGSQPYELQRTKSFEYSLYNLEAWFCLAELGNHYNIDVWHRENSTGGSPARGMSYLQEHIDDWPHPQLAIPSRSRLDDFCRRVQDRLAVTTSAD